MVTVDLSPLWDDRNPQTLCCFGTVASFTLGHINVWSFCLWRNNLTFLEIHLFTLLIRDHICALCSYYQDFWGYCWKRTSWEIQWLLLTLLKTVFYILIFVFLWQRATQNINMGNEITADKGSWAEIKSRWNEKCPFNPNRSHPWLYCAPN